MIDREKVLAVLLKRFPTASLEERAAAANAIVGLDDEWEEVRGPEAVMGYNYSVQCADICYLAELAARGEVFRVFRRVVPAT